MALVIARELIPPSSITVPFLGSPLPSFQPLDRQDLPDRLLAPDEDVPAGKDHLRKDR
jgi:hypothetical protein